LDFGSKLSALLKQVSCKITGLECESIQGFSGMTCGFTLSQFPYLCLLYLLCEKTSDIGLKQTRYSCIAVDGICEAMYSQWRNVKSVTKLYVKLSSMAKSDNFEIHLIKEPSEFLLSCLNT